MTTMAEEDFSDLDDILQQFKTVTTTESAPHDTRVDDPEDEILPPVPSTSKLPDTEKQLDAEEKATMQQFEQLMSNLMGTSASAEVPDLQAMFRDLVPESAVGADKTDTSEDPVDSAVNATLNRMRRNSTAATHGNGGIDDLFPGLGDNEGAGMMAMLEGMMGDMMSKEILYEPMSELNGKYPQYLQNNKSSLSKEDLERYTKQAGIVHNIIEKFDQESEKARKEEIESLIEEMQKLGDPPKEIMGDGDFLGGIGKTGDGCVIC